MLFLLIRVGVVVGLGVAGAKYIYNQYQINLEAKKKRQPEQKGEKGSTAESYKNLQAKNLANIILMAMRFKGNQEKTYTTQVTTFKCPVHMREDVLMRTKDLVIKAYPDIDLELFVDQDTGILYITSTVRKKKS